MLSLHRHGITFQPFKEDLAFRKILNILDELYTVNIQQQLKCKRFHFCLCAGECLSKDVQQGFQKKPVITLVFNLKALVVCI